MPQGSQSAQTLDYNKLNYITIYYIALPWYVELALYIYRHVRVFAFTVCMHFTVICCTWITVW